MHRYWYKENKYIPSIFTSATFVLYWLQVKSPHMEGPTLGPFDGLKRYPALLGHCPGQGVPTHVDKDRNGRPAG